MTDDDAPPPKPDGPPWPADFVAALHAGGNLIPSFNRENRLLLNGDDPTDGYFVSPYH